MPIVECKQVLESLPHNQSSSWCKAWPKQDDLQDDINSPPYFLAKNIVIPEQNVHQDNEESILYEIPHFKTSSLLQKKNYEYNKLLQFSRHHVLFHYLLVPRLFSEVTSWRITKRTKSEQGLKKTKFSQTFILALTSFYFISITLGVLKLFTFLVFNSIFYEFKIFYYIS